MLMLVHGAYHGAWCWNAVLDRLRAADVPALAPDLPGHGLDPGWLADQTMENYVGRIVAHIDDAPGPVTLVGHSMAGAIVALAAEARPDKIHRLVFLSAYIPADGESVDDLFRADRDSHVDVTAHDIGSVLAICVSENSLADAFYGDAGSDELLGIAGRIQMQSVVPFHAKASLSTARFGRVPKAAIVCRNDRAISCPHLEWMARRAGCDPIIPLESDHSPFITANDALAPLLIEFAR